MKYITNMFASRIQQQNPNAKGTPPKLTKPSGSGGKMNEHNEDDFGGHCGPKGYWRREEPDVISPKGVMRIKIMISKKAIKETIDMEEDELNEWIEKRKNGSWFANFEAVYIENHHPLKIKWSES